MNRLEKQLGSAEQKLNQRTPAAPKHAGNESNEAIKWAGNGSPLARTLSELKGSGAGGWLVVGSAVSDAHYAAKGIVINGDSVAFQTPDGGWEVIPYCGPTIKPGDKRIVMIDMAPLIQRLRARTKTGGGDVNTARMLARLRVLRRLPIRIRIVDTTTGWPELVAELAALEIEHAPLALTPPPRSLVLTHEGGPLDKMILKTNVPSAVSLNGEWNVAVSGLEQRLKVVLINSARPVEVIEAAIRTARQHGAAIYSVATPSISVDDRIRLLLPHSRITVMNLAEFKEVAAALGIACPDEEKRHAVAGVAEALDELRQTVFCQSAIITLGGVGMVIYDSRKGIIGHISLSDEARAQVRNYLRPEHICGIGDQIFAALVVAYEFFHGDEAQSSRIIHACRAAWADVLRSKSAFLNPSNRWFQMRLFPRGSLAEERFPLPVTQAAFENVSWSEQAL